MNFRKGDLCPDFENRYKLINYKEKDEVVSALIKERAEMAERNQARDKFLDKIMNNEYVVEEL